MFIAEPFVVSGSSMLPNFHDKDYLIIDRISYYTGQPQRGDVIVLKYPKDTSQFFIKRIIGLPGETVCLRQGQVLIYQGHATTEQCQQQGKALTEPYLSSQDITFGRPDAVPLGSDEYFVLGDNRTASSDSRVWGILPREDIIGKVWLRVFPIPRFDLFHTPTYSS